MKYGDIEQVGKSFILINLPTFSIYNTMKKYKTQHTEDDSIHEIHLEYFKESIKKDMKLWKITKSELNKIIKELQ